MSSPGAGRGAAGVGGGKPRWCEPPGCGGGPRSGRFPREPFLEVFWSVSGAAYLSAASRRGVLCKDFELSFVYGRMAREPCRDLLLRNKQTENPACTHKLFL